MQNPLPKLKRATILAAAAFTLTAASSRGAELNYTVDDLGVSRYVVDFYTSTNIGYGAGTWVYGARPVTPPVLTRSLSGVSQSGSINFLNYRNGALVQTSTGVAATIYGNVYQDGIGINTLFGAAIFGLVTVPNVSVGVNGVGSTVSYNLYNPNSYQAVLNVSDSTINATPGRDAIHSDAFVDLTLNLAGNSRINGAALATAINVSGSTTFNGNVSGTTQLAAGTAVTYTAQANQVNGDIGANAAAASTLTFLGGNTVNGTIALNRYANDSAINVAGAGVVFNGPIIDVSRIGFTTGGSLSFGYGTWVNADIDFHGNAATLSVGESVTVNGTIDTVGLNSGSLAFAGNATVTGATGVNGVFRQADFQGSASTVAYLNGDARINAVNVNSAGVVAFATRLDTRLADQALGTVRYFGADGEVQLGSLGGASDAFANFTTDADNTGVLTLVGGIQTVTGSVGAAGESLRLLNVGGANSGRGNDTAPNASSDATIDGDVHAQTVVLNSGNGLAITSLIMASGRNLTGTSLVDAQSRASLTLAGGVQAATFTTIGSALSRLDALYTAYVAGDVSTVTGTVYVRNAYTFGGRTDFANTLNATLYQVGQAGTANFNTVGGTTTFGTGIWLYDDATANFHQGMVGNAEFIGTGNTINIAAGKDVTGSVVGHGTGSLNFAGGSSLVTGLINNVAVLSVGSAGAGVGASSQGTLTVNGDISVGTISLANGSTLVAGGQVSGSIVTTSAGTGALTLTSGNQTVSGSIGTSSAHLAAATVAATGTTTQLNGSAPSAGVSYIDQVTFAGNGTLVLNGANGGAAAGGLVGSVDFTSGGQGTLAIGSGVNLTMGTGGLVLQNANAAHLSFLGDSTVVGQVGAPAVGGVLASSTPRDVYAGANGSVVNFGGKVFVSATTFHVVGTGTVNFADDLVGPLVYEANGTVNFADTKGVVGIVTTTNDGQGVLNYLGSTTLVGQIGAPGARLTSVNFHTDTTQASATQLIGQDIYAIDTTIGNTGVVSGHPTTTVASIVGNVHLGSTVTLADASTTLYTSGAQTLAGASVDFVHTKNADGTLSIGTVSRSTIDVNLVTNGATLGFAVASTPFTTSAGANGRVDAAASSLITLGGPLTLTGTETIQVSFLGSLRNAATATLVDANGGVTGAQAGTLRDNSYVIDTTLSRVNGDLVLTTHRDANTYVTKSNTLGSRGDALAIRLGTLAAAGTGYSASLQTVFDKLDLDQWGYGNNAANLARQLQLLTPAGDGAAVQTAFAATSQAVGSVLEGATELPVRPTAGNDYWVRAFGGRLTRDNGGEYAGFHANGGGAVVGTDRVFGQTTVGFALGYGTSTATSEGIRTGDKADVHTTLAGVYFRTPVGRYFVNAMLDVAKHATTTDRLTAVGERAHGDYNGNEYGGTVQFGRRFALEDKASSLTLMLAIDYARYRQAAYAETGAGDVGLSYAAQSYAQSDAELTLRYSRSESLGADVSRGWTAYLGYKRLLKSPSFDSQVSFIGDAQSFTVAGWQDDAKGSVTGGLSYTYTPSKGVTYSAEYEGEAKSGFSQHTFGVRATWSY